MEEFMIFSTGFSWGIVVVLVAYVLYECMNGMGD